MGDTLHWSDLHCRRNTNNSSGVHYDYYSDTAGANRLIQRSPGYKVRLDVLAASSRKVLVTLNFFAMPAPGLTTTAGELQAAKDTLVDQVRSLWNQRRLRVGLLVLRAVRVPDA